MGAETLHIVSDYLLNQLERGIRGEKEDWSEFHRLNRLKYAVLRSQGLDFSTAARHPFNFAAEESGTVVMQLIEIYREKDGFPRMFRDGVYVKPPYTGHREAIRSLRELYIRKEYEALELEFGFVLAQLAHSIYPTWCPGRIGLSFLYRMGWPVMNRIAANPATNLLSETNPKPHPLETQLSAGIYLDKEGVSLLYDALQGEELDRLSRLAGAKQIAEFEIDQAVELLLETLGFAKESGCGVMEAVGILDEDSMLTTV